MNKTLKCISPIDGSIFAERPVLGSSEALALVARSSAAQKAWAATPIRERIALVRKIGRASCRERV